MLRTPFIQPALMKSVTLFVSASNKTRQRLCVMGLYLMNSSGFSFFFFSECMTQIFYFNTNMMTVSLTSRLKTIFDTCAEMLRTSFLALLQCGEVAISCSTPTSPPPAQAPGARPGPKEQHDIWPVATCYCGHHQSWEDRRTC